MKKILVFGRSKDAPVKEQKPQGYKSLFIRETEMTARCGKTAYISKEHHERITRIVQVIGKETGGLSGASMATGLNFDSLSDTVKTVENPCRVGRRCNE